MRTLVAIRHPSSASACILLVDVDDFFLDFTPKGKRKEKNCYPYLDPVQVCDLDLLDDLFYIILYNFMRRNEHNLILFIILAFMITFPKL
jgi:hypothetical protein